MKPQVLTMVTAERSPSAASVKPARPNSPRMFSLSTWFLEQPRLTRRTLRSREGIAVGELLEARAVFLGTMDPVQGGAQRYQERRPLSAPPARTPDLPVRQRARIVVGRRRLGSRRGGGRRRRGGCRSGVRDRSGRRLGGRRRGWSRRR